MRNTKRMVAMLTAMMVSTTVFVPQTAFAAVRVQVGPGYPEEVSRDYQSQATDDVVMRRYNALPVYAKKIVSEAVENLPEGIVKLYKKANGKMYFRSHELTYNDKAADEKNYYDKGVYYKYNARIEILADHDALSELDTPIYHEFGHFLYNMTWSSLSDQAKAEVNDKLRANPECKTMEEAFADMYVEYKCGSTDSAHFTLCTEAENACERLAEQEFAPAE